MEIKKVDISDELRRSYLDYAMDVIVDRALPDARDGLKPVHRRILYAMHTLHLHFFQNGRKTATVKSARVVGEVIGKYHPHGDSAVYETMVRMAQPFSLRYPLIFGQGNFGSIDGDSAAAMRYTEVKLQKISDEILADLDKETVDLKKNFDSTLDIPDYVLPTRIPNLLVNGSSGIAVGLATNIPTHNISECIDASVALLKNPDITIDELMKYIPAPDFPTGAVIYGREGLRAAYHTGKGRAVVRSRCEIETDSSGRNTIVVTEIPYNVNKAEMVKQIASLVLDKKIEGISSITDVSDKNIRVEIELKKGAFPQVVLNHLFKRSSLQSVFSINMVAIVDGVPKTLNLKQALECFLNHRREVVTRRTAFLLSQARDRAHILEALLVALDNMDEIVRIIRSSEDRASAKTSLMGRPWTANACADLLARFGNACRPLYIDEEFGYRDGKYYLTETQTDRILDMRLAQLVKIAKNEVVDEYSQLYTSIAGYLEILNSVERLHEIIYEELIEIKQNYGDSRRTEIVDCESEITVEDLVPPDEVIISLSTQGYVKYQKLVDYGIARRGGKGRLAAKPKDDDFNRLMRIANTHDDLMIFTSLGKVFCIKVYQLPEVSSGNSRGRPIINMVNLEDGEQIMEIIPVKSYDDSHFMVTITKNGILKRTYLREYMNINSKGKKGLNLRSGDELVSACITTGRDDIMIFTAMGRVLRFNESKSLGKEKIEEMKLRHADNADMTEEQEFNSEELEEADNIDVSQDLNAADEQDETAASGSEGDASDDLIRPLSRTATGVKGIRLRNEDRVVSMVVPSSDSSYIFSISDNCKGRRTAIDDIPIRPARGGLGVVYGPANGDVGIVGATQVEDGDQLILSTNTGMMLRIDASDVRIVSRRAMGVNIMRLPEGAYITALQRIPAAIIPEGERAAAAENAEETSQAAVTDAADAEGSSSDSEATPQSDKE
jgi:DNA gyrase subunit A